MNIAIELIYPDGARRRFSVEDYIRLPIGEALYSSARIVNLDAEVASGVASEDDGTCSLQ